MQGERLPCKGSWLGAAETEGLYHRTLPALTGYLQLCIKSL